MLEKSMIVTNNPSVFEKYAERRKVEYMEGKTYMEVLEHVRDMLHAGHKLLTHPLSGSVKPNETPYKSILVSLEIKETLDRDGILIMEDAILTVRKFLGNFPTPNWTERVLDDFRVVDLSLMENTIDKLGH